MFKALGRAVTHCLATRKRDRRYLQARSHHSQTLESRQLLTGFGTEAIFDVELVTRCADGESPRALYPRFPRNAMQRCVPRWCQDAGHGGGPNPLHALRGARAALSFASVHATRPVHKRAAGMQGGGPRVQMAKNTAVDCAAPPLLSRDSL